MPEPLYRGYYDARGLGQLKWVAVRPRSEQVKCRHDFRIRSGLCTGKWGRVCRRCGMCSRG